MGGHTFALEMLELWDPMPDVVTCRVGLLGLGSRVEHAEVGLRVGSRRG